MARTPTLTAPCTPLPPTGAQQALRQRAESVIQDTAPNLLTREDLAAFAPEDIQRIIHELQVHQIELTMQNEELRRAQTAIDAARARYFALFELAPVGYCTLSATGLILEANLTAADLLGVPKSALIKQPLSRFVRKDDQDAYYLHRKRLFKTGESQECELRLVRPEGASFWVGLTATVAQADDGAPVCRVVISDVTERRRAEDALREQCDFAESLIETAQAIILVLDPQGRIVRFNPYMEQLVGYGLDEVKGLNWFETFLKSNDRPAVESLFQQAVADRQTCGSVNPIVAKDGRTILVEWYDKTLKAKDGRTVGLLAIGQDITEREARKRQLERLAQFDALTALPNRRLLADRLHQAMAQTQRGGGTWRWPISTWTASRPSTTFMDMTWATRC